MYLQPGRPKDFFGQTLTGDTGKDLPFRKHGHFLSKTKRL